jgi:hypothetical protein
VKSEIDLVYSQKLIVVFLFYQTSGIRPNLLAFSRIIDAEFRHLPGL